MNMIKRLLERLQGLTVAPDSLRSARLLKGNKHVKAVKLIFKMQGDGCGNVE